MIKALAPVLQDGGPPNDQEPYFEKRSTMVVLFPRVETMEISLAVTLADCDAHCEWLKGIKDAISIAAVDPLQEQAGNLRGKKSRMT